MPAHHFGNRGYPRNGQWVLVDGNDSPELKALAKLGMVEADTSGCFLGIFGGVNEDRGDTPQITDAQGKTVVVKPSPRPNKIKRSFWVLVHMVGPKGENLPGGTIGTTLDKLYPLLDKSVIPAERRATMNPAWEPSP